MRWSSRFVVLLVLAGLSPVLPAVAAAASAGPTVTLTAPGQARRGASVPLRAVVTDAEGQPVAGTPVRFETETPQAWSEVGTAITGADGTASVSVTAPGTQAAFRARTAEATSSSVEVVLVQVASRLSVSGPAAVVDEQAAVLRMTWTGSDGLPVRGPVRVWVHRRGQSWQPGPTLVPDVAGRTTLVTRPRVDSWFQVRGAAGAGWTAATSPTLYVDNKPVLAPVVLPRRAPRPRPLPAQRRAVGNGVNVVATTVPDAVWRSMVGRSWRPGCPLGRGQLRYLQTNYWGFDGYRHRGELVVSAGVVPDVTRAMTGLYAARTRIRSMYLPDRFGYSRRSGGANDYASMAADNTSAFNCRWVTGWWGRRSPHSYGRSLDLNPLENPFLTSGGWLPSSWWARRSAPYAWRSGKHPVVKVMRRSGCRWTYPRSDPQHFDC